MSSPSGMQSDSDLHLFSLTNLNTKTLSIKLSLNRFIFTQIGLDDGMKQGHSRGNLEFGAKCQKTCFNMRMGANLYDIFNSQTFS